MTVLTATAGYFRVLLRVLRLLRFPRKGRDRDGGKDVGRRELRPTFHSGVRRSNCPF